MNCGTKLKLAMNTKLKNSYIERCFVLSTKENEVDGMPIIESNHRFSFSWKDVENLNECEDTKYCKIRMYSGQVFVVLLDYDYCADKFERAESANILNFN